MFKLMLATVINFTPVSFISANNDKITIFVSSDVIKNEQGYRNFTGKEAREFAKKNYSLLPTEEMANAIAEQATCKVIPTPYDPASPTSAQRHSAQVESQVAECPDKRLISGGFKDIMYNTNRDRVAIYGWFYPDGRKIQPYSEFHDSDYTDYSHGLRYISSLVIINGTLLRLEQDL